MNEFFTWELLATYTGACLGTGVVTELLKGLFPAAPGRRIYFFGVLWYAGAVDRAKRGEWA